MGGKRKKLHEIARALGVLSELLHEILHHHMNMKKLQQDW